MKGNSPGGVPGPAAALAGGLLEIQAPEPYPRTTEPNSLRGGSQNLFDQAPQGILKHAKVQDLLP